jgi:RND family efflux transporter MFP subunit
MQDESADTHSPATEESIVTISKKQFDAIQIGLGNIEQKSLIDNFRVSGVLKVPPQNKANITAFMGGTVHTILVQEGDAVEKGQVLATLINPDYIKIQREYLNAQSQLSFLKADYERQKDLYEKNVTAQKSYQQAESNYNSVRAEYNALKQQLMLLGIDPSSLTADNISSEVKLKSPIGGHIAHIDIRIGSTVESYKVLMDVVDNSKLHLDLFIYEQDLAKVKIGQVVEVLLTNLPGKNYTAEIFAIGSAFEGGSKSIPVHASITGNKTGLIEGMNVTANINTGKNQTPAVPVSAIINHGGNDFIFILMDEHLDHHHAGTDSAHSHVANDDMYSFKRISVKKGATNDSFTGITFLQQAPENLKVVVSGSFYLMSMLTNSDEGHEH